jgi:hypothetical protein
MIRDESEKELLIFFQAMKEKDGEIPTPDFPEVAEARTINWWIPMGIAATLLIGFILLEEKDHSSPPIGDVVIITLEKGTDQKMHFNIDHTNEMDIWESPTASLLTEY